jgi:hypothetical protein
MALFWFQIPFVGVALCPEVDVNSTLNKNFYHDWRRALEKNEITPSNLTESQ